MKRVILFLFFSTLVIKGNAQLIISPNPFSTQTTISYTVATTDTVTLKVYNMLGNIVKTFMNDSLVNAGTYTINYNPSNLSTGIYFFFFSTGDSIYKKKIIYQGGVGINQITKRANTSFIYPNPAKNSININYEGVKKIEILSLNGKIIKSFTTSDKIMSISDINSGEYIVNIYTEGNKLIATEKLFKTE